MDSRLRASFVRSSNNMSNGATKHAKIMNNHNTNTMLKTIDQAAKDYEIAAIRIHSLILKGHITRCVKQPAPGRRAQIMVDIDELNRYFFENPEMLTVWRAGYTDTQSKTIK